MRRLAALVLVLLASSSAARAESPPAPLERSVDLLIVVDTSPGAAGARAAFAAGIPAFVQLLEQELHSQVGAGIDLHVGVVTADRADGGAMRTVAVADCAAAPTGPYIKYERNEWAQGTQNFTGTLADAMRCLVPVDAHGSSTTEPLAAIRAALGIPSSANEGFLRPSGALAVLVVTTHDDCSTIGAPLDPFACAAAGWQCTPAIDATPGTRANCGATAGSNGLLIPQIDDFLGSFRESKAQIAFGVVRGLPAPVAVASGPSIAPSCSKGAIAATPALRLDAAANMFTNSWLEVACDDAGFASFVYPIVAATYPPPPVGHDGVYCDGGSYGDFSDAGVGHGLDDRTHAFGCACNTGAPSPGTGALSAFALAFALRRRRRRNERR